MALSFTGVAGDGNLGSILNRSGYSGPSGFTLHEVLHVETVDYGPYHELVFYLGAHAANVAQEASVTEDPNPDLAASGATTHTVLGFHVANSHGGWFMWPLPTEILSDNNFGTYGWQREVLYKKVKGESGYLILYPPLDLSDTTDVRSPVWNAVRDKIANKRFLKFTFRGLWFHTSLPGYWPAKHHYAIANLNFDNADHANQQGSYQNNWVTMGHEYMYNSQGNLLQPPNLTYQQVVSNGNWNPNSSWWYGSGAVYYKANTEWVQRPVSVNGTSYTLYAYDDPQYTLPQAAIGMPNIIFDTTGLTVVNYSTVRAEQNHAGGTLDMTTRFSAELFTRNTWVALPETDMSGLETLKVHRQVSVSGNRFALRGHIQTATDTSPKWLTRVYEWNDSSGWQRLGGDEDFHERGPAENLNAREGPISLSGDKIAIRGYYGFRVYQWSGSSWSRLGTNDYLGGRQVSTADAGISLDGNRIALGSQTQNVQIYEWNGNDWQQIGDLATATDAYTTTGGGLHVSLSGNRVAFTTRHRSGGKDHQSCRVYEYTGGQWTRLGSDDNTFSTHEEVQATYGSFNLTGPTYSRPNCLSISLDQNRLAIGQTQFDPNKNDHYYNDQWGRCRVFEWNGSSWTQIGPDMVGPESGRSFGWSVSLKGDIVSVGQSYTCHVYEFDGQEQWNPMSGLPILNAASGDLGAMSVSLSETHLMLGNTSSDFYYGSGTDSYYLYRLEPPVALGAMTQGTINVQPASIDLSVAGSFQVTAVATTAAGRQTAMTRIVQVVDTTPPVITLNGLTEMVILQYSTWNDPGYTVSGESTIPVVTIYGDMVNTWSLDTYNVIYSAEDDQGNRAEVVRYVTVNAAPTLDITNPVVYIKQFEGPVGVDDLTFSDSGPGPTPPTVPVRFLVGAYGGYYWYYPAYRSQADRVASGEGAPNTNFGPEEIVTDHGTFWMSSDTIQYLNFASAANAATTVPRDNRVVITGHVDYETVGTYTINYEATDIPGSSTTATRTVHVTDGVPPSIQSFDAIPQTIGGQNAISVKVTLADADDNANGKIYCVVQSAGYVTVINQMIQNYNVIDPDIYVPFMGLVQNTQYYISLILEDAAGNRTGILQQGTVTTGDATAPVVTLELHSLLQNQVSVKVETNEPGTYTVAVAATASQLAYSAASRQINLVDYYVVSLTSIEHGTGFVIGVKVTDLAGNETEVTTTGTRPADTTAPTLEFPTQLDGTLQPLRVEWRTGRVTVDDVVFKDPDTNNAVRFAVEVPGQGWRYPLYKTGGGVTHFESEDLGGLDLYEDSTTQTIQADVTNNNSVLFSQPVIKLSIHPNGPIDRFTVGQYKLTYQAVDAANNLSSLYVRDVHVEDGVNPVLTLDTDTVIADLYGTNPDALDIFTNCSFTDGQQTATEIAFIINGTKYFTDNLDGRRTQVVVTNYLTLYQDDGALFVDGYYPLYPTAQAGTQTITINATTYHIPSTGSYDGTSNNHYVRGTVTVSVPPNPTLPTVLDTTMPATLTFAFDPEDSHGNSGVRQLADLTVARDMTVPIVITPATTPIVAVELDTSSIEDATPFTIDGHVTPKISYDGSTYTFTDAGPYSVSAISNPAIDLTTVGTYAVPFLVVYTDPNDNKSAVFQTKTVNFKVQPLPAGDPYIRLFWVGWRDRWPGWSFSDESRLACTRDNDELYPTIGECIPSETRGSNGAAYSDIRWAPNI